MGEVIAPEAPVITLDLTAGLAALVGLVLALALRTFWLQTIGRLLDALASVLNIHVGPVHFGLGKYVDALNTTVERELGGFVHAMERPFALWLHANVQAWKWTVDGLGWFAAGVHQAFDNVVHGTLPRVIHDTTHTVTVKVGSVSVALRAQVAALERELNAKAKGLERTLELEFGKAWRGIDHIRGQAIPRLWHSVAGLEADVAGLEHSVGRVIPHRLTRLEKLLGAGVLGGIAIAALARVFPYFQCSNVKRAMRGICRADRALLDLLLGVGVEAAITLNICQAVKVMTAAADAFEPELRGLVAVTGAAVQCSGGDAPTILNVRGVALPGVGSYSDLPV